MKSSFPMPASSISTFLLAAREWERASMTSFTALSDISRLRATSFEMTVKLSGTTGM